MRVMILNGNPVPSGFDGSVETLAGALRERGGEVDHVVLRESDVRLCIGCWFCWWKTPGLCVHRDAMDDILPKMVASDLVIWASPLVMGAVSYLLKAAQDRFIPLAHPYIEIYRDECHHRHRYANNADVALFTASGPDDSPEDLDLARKFFERFTLNTRTALRFVATTDTPVREVCDEAFVR